MKKLKFKKLHTLKEFVLSRDQAKGIKGGLKPKPETSVSKNGD